MPLVPGRFCGSGAADLRDALSGVGTGLMVGIFLAMLNMWAMGLWEGFQIIA